MAVTSTDDFKSGSFPSSYECDQMLERAELTAHWQPEHIDPWLKRLGGEVLFLADTRYTLTDQETELVNNFVSAITSEAHHLFSVACSAQRPSFRTHAAIKKGSGNCMAYAEAVNGMLRTCELESYSVGQWFGGHATNGLVVGKSTFLLDGFSDEAEDNTEHLSQNEAIYNAWFDTTRDDVITVLDRSDSGYISNHIKSTDLQDVCINDRYRTGLVLPGSAAILMYSAMAATNPHNLSHIEARDVLATYAPVTIR